MITQLHSPTIKIYHSIYVLIFIAALDIDVAFLKLEHLFLLLIFIFYSLQINIAPFVKSINVALLLIIGFGLASSAVHLPRQHGDMLMLMDQVVEGYANLLFPIMFMLLISKAQLNTAQLSNMVMFSIVLSLLSSLVHQLYLYVPGYEMPGAKLLVLMLPLLLSNKRNIIIIIMTLVSIGLFYNSYQVYFSRGIAVLFILSAIISVYFHIKMRKSLVVSVLIVVILALSYMPILSSISAIKGVERFDQVINVLPVLFETPWSQLMNIDWYDYGGYGVRLMIYLTAVGLALSSEIPLILGHGPGMFDYLSGLNFGSHSSFFGFLSEYGVAALLAFVYVGYRSVKIYISLYDYSRKFYLAHVNIYLFSAVYIVLSFMYSFTESFYFPQGGRDVFAGNILMWLLIGWSLSRRGCPQSMCNV